MVFLIHGPHSSRELLHGRNFQILTRLWDDFIHEEIWEESITGQQVGDDENLALASQARRSRGNTSGEKTPQTGKKKDLRKVKLFACHKSGQLCFTVSEQEEREESTSASSDICRSSSQGFC
jgi:hypothetical protein